MSSWTKLWNATDRRVLFCKECLQKEYERNSNMYQSAEMALKISCARLDIPFYSSLYSSIINSNPSFGLGSYIRVVNTNRQYVNKGFAHSIVSGEFSNVVRNDDEPIDAEQEDQAEDFEHLDEVVAIVGYDPFEGYKQEDRKFLFNEIVKFFEIDDDISEDPYKLSQIIQIVVNNNQIRKYDLQISSMDPASDANDIKVVNEIKSKLVRDNDKIAKENEISVKNRSNKEVGKSTLTKLQISLREMGLDDAEENFYSQLNSPGTKWAIDMSHKSLIEHGFFDENDKQEIFDMTRELNIKLQSELDDEKEKNRLLQIQLDLLKKDNDV